MSDRRMAEAAVAIATDLRDAFVESLATHLTCGEANDVAWFYREVGKPADGDAILLAHAYGDSALEGDDQDHIALAAKAEKEQTDG